MMINAKPSVLLALVAVALLGIAPAFSQLGLKLFRNAYIEFEMPDAWECRLDGTEFVCQEDGRSQVSMIAILTAKEADPERDNIGVYESQLVQPREWRNRQGALVVSSRIKSETACHGGRRWQWARHYESEIERYYTEYFARIESDIAILVTVSFHHSVEAEGSAIARTIARRLRVLDRSPGSPSESTPDC